ncbi:cbb3-type cytochrome oxidase subunit 3 [Thermomonas flagellata]|uniref:cbb3-type cytochrome oxidase subunit 3 n=1 Tax=Thermomonas flagellata TaxID=2888524 RepID=UPI0023D8E1F5|nr:cbb3-type cytochrome c oxidase subunit 3 [Thermomonas flagellata]
MVYGIVTLLLMLIFIGGWIWAWSPRRKKAFDEAARLALDDADTTQGGKKQGADSDAHSERGDTP